MKTQMKFQKIMCLVMLLAGALSAVYCFIYCTGGLANIGLSISKDANGVKYTEGFEEAQQLYLDVQPFNTALLILSIVMILAAAFLYITATNKRRNYYVTNYVATGLVCAIDVGISIYVLVMNSIFMGRFLNITNNPDMVAKWQEIVTAYNGAISYSPSPWPFALGYVIYILVILACVALVLNLVWKIKLMKGERELLSGKAVAEVA